MVDKETFVSQTNKAFKWPYPKPLTAKPLKPPLNTKPKNFFIKGQVDPVCHCDAHLYDPLVNRYEKLGEKEKLLVDEILKLNAEMAEVGREMVDQACASFNDKMESTYQVDYIKRGMEPVDYEKLMPHVDSPAGPPQPKNAIGGGLRDPTRFTYSAFPKPTTDVCPTPANGVEQWFTGTFGRSEYQDTYSKVGLSVLKNMQKYVDPLPASRKKYG